MGKMSGKPGPDPRSPIGSDSVRGYGHGGASGDPPKEVSKKESKKIKDWMKTHRA